MIPDLQDLFADELKADNELPRIIVWVSAGAASACAWKLAVNKYGDRALGVYCDTSKSEDEGKQAEDTNIVILKQIAKWVGQELVMIRSDKFQTIDEVFEKTRYMAGQRGARCTTEVKKIPRLKFQRASDVHVFGYDAKEKKRIADFELKNPDLKLEWILRDNNVSKKDCLTMIKSAGITTPIRYRQGFKNNNCPCCVKASSIAYWVLERRTNPEIFARRARQSREINARLTRWKGKRIFLDELPPDEQIPKRFLKKSMMENVSCGPECGQ